MVYKVCCYFLIFFIFSCIGYICEVLYTSSKENRLILSRGFLVGPYIPIYGVGSFLIIYLLNKYYKDPIAFFCLTIIICSIIEYLTSFLMEKIFKVRWWDYSNNKFNLNGRVCLFNSILFGLGGLVILYIIMPPLYIIMIKIPKDILCITALFLLTIFLLDFIMTTCALFRVKSTLQKIDTKDITEQAKEEVIKEITKHIYSFNRIFKTFPRIDIINKNNIKELRKLIMQIKQNTSKK